MVAGFRSGAVAVVLALCIALTFPARPALASYRAFTAGTGISITVTPGASSEVIGNSGVTGLTGTANQVNVSASTGAVTLSLVGPYTPATYTAHGALVGEGTSSIAALAAGTNGQVLVGSTGADPAFATIGCTGCTWTTGAGSLSLSISTGSYSTVTNNPSCGAGYTVLSTDVYIRASALSGGDCTLNLPAASGNIGRSIVVKREDANAHNVLVHPNGTDTIDGTNSNYTMGIQYETFAFTVGGTGAWDVN